VGDLHWARPVPIHTSDDHGTLDDATAAVGPELRPLLLRMLADDPQVRPTAGEAALALYRVAAAEPVALVGHHPDPAAAVTNRIRREAAETRSRSQLRAVEKAAHRQRIRQRRRARLRHPLRRMPVQPSPSAAPPHLLTYSSPRGKAPQSGLPPSSRRRAAVASALAVGLILVAIGVFRWTDPFSTVLTTTPVADATALEPTPLSTGSAAISSVDADNVAADHVPGDGVAADTVGAGTVPRGSPATGGPQAEVTADPLAVLQHIADIRAGALREAESLALAAVEPEGSSAYENDVRTLARLRDQGQRYGDLAFVVRSADVVTADAATVVLRAQIDRAACTVVGPDGSVQTLPEQRGPTLRYTVQRARSGWQLTDVEAA
jgi:hypothetical protein